MRNVSIQNYARQTYVISKNFHCTHNRIKQRNFFGEHCTLDDSSNLFICSCIFEEACL